MDQDFGIWQVESQTPRIEYSLAVMEELRVYAEEGFQKIPHGGIEVGALLLGKRDGENIKISEWRPMACEHARGPGFTLSDADREALRESVASLSKTPELRDLTVVGWFHTHTRSKIFLSSEDLTVHESFFTEPWQIALVMKPQKDQPALAGFFVRDATGNLSGESSALEFSVRPDVAQTLKPKRPSAGGSFVGTARVVSGRPEGMARNERPMFRPVGEPRIPAELTAGRGRPLFDSPPRGHEATPAAEVPSLPRVLSMPAPAAPAAAEFETTAPVWLNRRVMTAAALLLMLAAAGLALQQWRSTRNGQNAALKVEEVDQSLVITWDNAAGAVMAAERGALRIVDGSTVRTVPLSQAAVRNGAVTYMRQADDVEVRLTLIRDNQTSIQGFARFVGGPETAPNSAAGNTGAQVSPSLERVQLQADVAKLRETLREESDRAQRLREELTLLERTATAGGFKIPAGGPAVPRR
jgi:proteasome lid subunit RPN8/RPN11